MAKPKFTPTELMKKLLEADKYLHENDVSVGWFANSKYPNGTPVAYVAAIQDQGSPASGIPARPIIAPAITRLREDRENVSRKILQKLLTGKITGPQTLKQLGEFGRNCVQSQIASVFEPPLAESTLADRRRRGNPNVKPLQDTNTMYRTVQHEVKKA